jgi:transposase
MLLFQLKMELDQLAIRIDEADGVMEQASRENDACRRLLSIPGVGPVTATAIIAAIGNGAAFRKGREFSAWVGMVPREDSTGGKQRLLGISKRGNDYLRRLFVQGSSGVADVAIARDFQAWLYQASSAALSRRHTIS